MGFQATNVALAADEIEKMVRSRSPVPRANLVPPSRRVCSITLQQMSLSSHPCS